MLLAGMLSVATSFGIASEEPSAQLDEVTVTGERAGPGLWHVYQGPGSGQLWILGSVSPLPKSRTKGGAPGAVSR